MRRQWSIAVGFLALIAIGAVVLSAPFARNAGSWGNFSGAIFTSFSAVCVTGLSVLDIAEEYTRAGQIVLMVLVQIGCLGLMTCGTFLLVAIGRRLSLAREFSLMNAYGVAQVQGLKGLIVWVVGCMLGVELIGAALLWIRFRTLFPDDAVYMSAFYSMMSFCNAGFGILPGSLAPFADHPYVILVCAFLTIAGGFGFLAIYNLCTFKFLRRKSGGKGRLTLHTRLVMRFTGYLLAAAFVAFVLVEWNGALEGMSFMKKMWVSFYQAVTPRTCGFCVVPTESLHPLTRLIYGALMFIGGGPGSASAGIKITTFAVLVYTLTAMCRGETETVIQRKTVPPDIVRESIVIFTALTVLAFMIAGALFVTEGEAVRSGKTTLEALLFEAFSAITTTGLSMGSTTANLSSAGRFVIIVAMFFGRLGALSVVMLIGDRESKRQIKFPSEELVVG
jgi:trk system potassium uptake protein TrkH